MSENLFENGLSSYAFENEITLSNSVLTKVLQTRGLTSHLCLHILFFFVHICQDMHSRANRLKLKSVSTRAVIGQCCRPYSTLWPTKFESFLSRSPDEPQRYNKYLTNRVFLVLTVRYGS